MIEFFFGFVLEFLFAFAPELILDFGARAIGNTVPSKSRHPVLAFAGFVILGAIVGGVSLLLFPDAMIEDPPARNIALFAVPIFVAGSMSLIGWALRKRGKPTTRLETFIYAYVFALAVGLTRYAAID